MKVRLLTSFAGALGDYDSPATGTVIDVSPTLGAALCADGRAVALASAPEAAATVGAPERAMRPAAAKRKGER